jgi:hypothetical protein
VPKYGQMYWYTNDVAFVESHNTVAVSCDIPEVVSSVCGKAVMFGDRIKETPVFEHCQVSYFILLFRPTNTQYIKSNVYFEKVLRCVSMH